MIGYRSRREKTDGGWGQFRPPRRGQCRLPQPEVAAESGDVLSCAELIKMLDLQRRLDAFEQVEAPRNGSGPCEAR